MKSRFQLRKLEFVGIKNQASVAFQSGLNVIHGKSNTGKSLVLSAIQYAFGKDVYNEFQDIKELKKYDHIKVTVETNKNKYFTIEREIFNSKADIKVLNCETGERTLYRPKNSKVNKDTVSSFLLHITSAENLKIKKNSNGTKINFTFDKEMVVSMLNETNIISNKYSPFISGERLTKSSEISAFKVILTDKDDSECEEVENGKIYKSKLKSNITLIEELKQQVIKEIERSLDEFGNLNQKIVEERLISIKKEIKTQNKKLSEFLREKKTLNNELTSVRSKKLFSSEVLSRFELHKSNLLNDSKRLEFIIEGNHYINQLIDTECPLCNSSIKVENFIGNNGFNSDLYGNLEIAYKSEYTKIIAQLNDIEESISYHLTEIEKLTKSESDIIKKINVVEHFLKQDIGPRIDSLDIELERLNDLKGEFSKINEKRNQLKVLEKRAFSINCSLNSAAPKCTYEKSVSVDEISILTNLIQSNLQQWNYSNVELVSFDIDTLEISINSKLRISNGKGHRAIIAASMVISLMEYAIQRDRIHPGFVILDSPLLSLRERENIETIDEIVDDTIANAFYRKIALKEETQVLVLENKEPPSDININANLIEFTGDESKGRYGLLELN